MPSVERSATIADQDVAFAGAARQAEMVRAGEVSATELVQLSLDRIARLDPELNAFRKVLAEKALLEAEQAEARLKAGEERPLLGVPIAIKNEVDVAGEVNTHGTDGFTEPAAADSEMVRRLREAGAIVVGLTLMPELGICGFTESATYGVTRNPWNLQRSPGWLERRQRGGGRLGDGPDRLRRRRRRLDPDPRRLVPGCSASSPSAAGSRWPPTANPGTASSSSAASAARCSTARSGSTSAAAGRTRPARRPRPTARSSRRRGRRPGSCGSPGRRRPPRAAVPPKVPEFVEAAVTDTAELLGSLGHEVSERDPDWGGIGNNITARFLRGVSDDVAQGPASRAARTADPRLRPPRLAPPRRPVRAGAAGAARPTPPGSTRSSTPSTS